MRNPFSSLSSNGRRARPRRLRRICAFGGRGPAAGAIAFVLLLASVAAFASEGDADAIQAGPGLESTESDKPIRDYAVWPFVYTDETSEWRQFSFIPFYVERESTDDTQKRVQFLWPIYLYKRTDRDVAIRIVPFFTYWRDVYEYAGGDEYFSQYMIFPIIYGSDTPEEGRSFAVFPLGGRMKNFLGRDEIGFLLFPLYMYYTKDGLRQRNYLWPVLSFTEGDGARGFRFWPFYGYFEREGESRSEFVLWPFYSRQVFDLDTERPGERLMVFPFYAREDSRGRRYRSVLWPLFSHELNYARNFEQRSMPWPFIVIARGDIYRTHIWPLYGFKQDEDSWKRFVLWPFWHEGEFIVDDELKIRETRLFPVWSSKTQADGSGEIKTHRARFWPLWRFRRFEDGSTRLRMLSLLWFYDERGFERHYSPLWTIYERDEGPGGDSDTRILWGLIRHSRRGDRTEARVPLLFSRTADAGRDTAVTRILGGVFAGVRENGKRGLRLFYFRKPAEAQ